MADYTSPDPWRPYPEDGKLQSVVDDEIDPTTMTMFSMEQDDITTAWMSIDIEHVIDLYDAV